MINSQKKENSCEFTDKITISNNTSILDKISSITRSGDSDNITQNFNNIKKNIIENTAIHIVKDMYFFYGKEIIEIAKEMNMPEEKIKATLKDGSSRMPKRDGISPYVLINLLNKKWTPKRIAVHLGCNIKNIYRLITKYTKMYPEQFRTFNRDSDMVEMDEQDFYKLGYKQLSDKYNLSENQIYRIKNKLGAILKSEEIIDRRTLLEWKNEGKTLMDVAKLMNYSISTVKRWYINEGVEPPKTSTESVIKTKNIKNLLIELINKGLSDTDIMRQTNATYSQLQNFKSRNNLTDKLSKPLAISLKQFEDWYIVEGYSIRKISKLTNISEIDLDKFRIKHKITKFD